MRGSNALSFAYLSKKFLLEASFCPAFTVNKGLKKREDKKAIKIKHTLQSKLSFIKPYIRK